MKKIKYILASLLTITSLTAHAQVYDVKFTEEGATEAAFTGVNAYLVTFSYNNGAPTVKFNSGKTASEAQCLGHAPKYYITFGTASSAINNGTGDPDEDNYTVWAGAKPRKTVSQDPQEPTITEPIIVFKFASSDSTYTMNSENSIITLKYDGTNYMVNSSGSNDTLSNVQAIYYSFTPADMVKTDAVAATCDTPGRSTYYQCSYCGRFFSDNAAKNEIAKEAWIIPALGHTFTEGATSGECSVCHKNIAYDGNEANAAGTANAIHWQLVKNGETDTYTLEINGTGAIKDYACDGNTDYQPNMPWFISSEINDKVTSICLGSGITGIGQYAFYGCPAHSVTFTSDTKPTIAAKAFSNLMANVIYPSTWEDMSGDFGGKFMTWLKGGQLSEADTPTALTLNGEEEFNATAANGSYKFYTFTPQTSGLYCYNISGTTGDQYSIYLYDNSALTSYVSYMNSSMAFEMEGGKTYYLKVCSYEINIISNSITIPATSGNFGENNALTWSYSNGTMTLGGNGAVNCRINRSGTAAPYAIYCYLVTKLVVGNGITSIGEYAFKGAPKLSTVEFGEGSTCTTLGSGVFDSTPMTTLTLPASCTSMWGAFGNSHIQKLYVAMPDFADESKYHTAASGSTPESWQNFVNSRNAMDVYFLHQAPYEKVKEHAYSTTILHAPIAIIAQAGALGTIEFASAYSDGQHSIASCNLREALLTRSMNPNAFTWKKGEDVVNSKETFTNITENMVGTPIEGKQIIAVLDGKAYSRSTDLNDFSFAYIRTFGGTNWTTWYVPFELELTDEICAKYDFSRINNVHQYDEDNDGVADRTVIESFRQKSGKTLKANYPYLVRAKSDADKEMELNLANVTMVKALENSIDCQSMDVKYTFTGTYTGKDYGEGASTEYSLFDDDTNGWERFGALKPMRHYMTITPLNGSNPNNAPRHIELKVVGDEDDTTDISLTPTLSQGEGVRKYFENSKLVIVKNGKKYNINGQILK